RPLGGDDLADRRPESLRATIVLRPARLAARDPARASRAHDSRARARGACPRRDARPVAMDGPSSILVPFDDSAASRAALAHAVELAARRRGRVTLLGVVPDQPLGMGGAFFVPPVLCALELESELLRFIEGAIDGVKGRVPMSGAIRRGRWTDEVLA